MPDFAGLVRNLLGSVAAPLTASFDQPVTWQHVTDDGRGNETPGAAVLVNGQNPQAKIDRTRKVYTTSNGQRAILVADLLFVTPLSGVDGRDIFTLPDGTTAPIVDFGGFEDPVTGAAFVTSVKLGQVARGE